MGVGQTATASLVPLGLPNRVNRRSTVAEHARVAIEIVVRGIARWQSKRFDKAVGQANSQ